VSEDLSAEIFTTLRCSQLPAACLASSHQHALLSLQAVLEAPPAAAKAKLSEKHLQLLQQHKGPLVKIATHYHVRFGDCLKVIGSSKELGAWKAADAPLMKWREGDVWTLLLPLAPGEYEFKVGSAAALRF
jgi:hypothetical protein